MFAPVLGLMMTTAMLNASTKRNPAHLRDAKPDLRAEAIVHLDTNCSMVVSMLVIGLRCEAAGFFGAAAEIGA